MICWIEKKVSFKTFDHKGAIEKCVGCLGVFFNEKVSWDEGSDFAMCPVLGRCTYQ